MRIVFLDLDGVTHTFKGDGWFHPANMECLETILRTTGVKVVLSSSWRYQTISPTGMRELEGELRHAGAPSLEIIGSTILDEECAHCGGPMESGEDCYRCGIPTTRADQVWAYIVAHKVERPYVVIDDSDFGFTTGGLPFVHVDADFGLTEEDAAKAIELLTV